MLVHSVFLQNGRLDTKMRTRITNKRVGPRCAAIQKSGCYAYRMRQVSQFCVQEEYGGKELVWDCWQVTPPVVKLMYKISAAKSRIIYPEV